jgi:hypothetical protein
MGIHCKTQLLLAEANVSSSRDGEGRPLTVVSYEPEMRWPLPTASASTASK